MNPSRASAPTHPADQDRLHKAAAAWMLRVNDPEVTADELTAWQAWLRRDPRHAKAFTRMEELSGLLSDVPRPNLPGARELTLDTYNASSPIRLWEAGRSQSLRRMRLAASIAAAALGLALAGHYLGSGDMHLRTAGTPTANAFSTSIGENRSVVLADGSKVTLGGDSEIQVRLARTERQIDLKRGEAFFAVAKDPTRPFKVAAGRALVVAVGTEFTVNRVRDRVVVDVVEGRVRVEPRSSLLPMTVLTTFRPKLKPVSVSAGQETTIAALAITPATPLAEPADVTAWTAGRLAFRMEPLEGVLEDVNRYTKKPIVLGDPRIANMKVTGTIMADSISGWLTSLPSALGVVAVEERDQIVLYQAQ